MTTFYFVRHAHANWMPDENRPLSESGLTKADRVADILTSHPITAIYASPYRRAHQTVEPLAKQLNLPLQILDDLRERQLAAEPFDTVDGFDAGVKAVWADPAFAHAGGESNMVAQKRGAVLIEQLSAKHADGHIVLGTHGNLMALMLQHFLPSCDYDFWQALSMPDIYRLSIKDEPELSQLWTEIAD